MRDVVILGGGISGLATAYHLQELAKKEKIGLNLTILEREKRIGGKILSHREDGFLCEAGPSAFLDNKPEAPKLADALNLKPSPSMHAAKKRYILLGGRLRLVPESFGSFLRSDILSIKGKIRVLMELFTKPSKEEDESIADFGRRHLGGEAQKKLLDSIIAGIYAGDTEELSVKSCFPVMIALEKEGNGSLLRAMFKRMKKAKKDKKVRATPTGNLTSFKEGMESMIEALASSLDAQIYAGKTVSEVNRKNGRYVVAVKGDKRTIKADAVVLAVPAYSAAEVLSGMDKRFTDPLTNIPYAPAAIVCTGYRTEDVPGGVDGYGFLVPKMEGRRLLGCRWDSSTFKGRAPPGHVLLWNIVGGATNPELASLHDEGLLRFVKAELRDVMDIHDEPVFVRIFRHEKAIPQYTIGHSQRIGAVEEIVEDYPGLFITGNAYKGIGVEDCARNAPITAGAVLEYLKRLE